MSLTMIDFKKSGTVYKNLAEELAEIVNAHTIASGTFEAEEVQRIGCSAKELGFCYTTFTIRFKTEEDSTLRIMIGGNSSSSLNLKETRHVYALLCACAVGYLKKQDINIFVSLSFYHFSESGIDLGECFGPYNFADFECNYKATPVSDELKNLQTLVPLISKYFPINNNGKKIETGKYKFRKIYGLDLVNDGTDAKIGVFDDILLYTIRSKKEVEDLVALKTTKLLELQKVKEDALKTLSGLDKKFEYDGKNGVVLFGEKVTISIEYDIFKQEYLMVFLKSKVKATTIKAVEEKIKKLIVKKTAILK